MVFCPIFENFWRTNWKQILKLLRKTGSKVKYSREKIIRAITKSADRINETFTEKELNAICSFVEVEIEKEKTNEIPVSKMHIFVELALDNIKPNVAKSYREYRNYKTDFVHIMDDVLKTSKSIRYIGDRDNANTDSALVATKRSLIYKKLNKELYQKFFLNDEERKAIKTGYIYIHD